jgi:hypothetical protein
MVIVEQSRYNEMIHKLVTSDSLSFNNVVVGVGTLVYGRSLHCLTGTRGWLNNMRYREESGSVNMLRLN